MISITGLIVLSPHSKEATGSNPGPGPFCVKFACPFLCLCGFRSIGESTFTLGVTVNGVCVQGVFPSFALCGQVRVKIVLAVS